MQMPVYLLDANGVILTDDLGNNLVFLDPYITVRLSTM
jgi:hypothetical protein